MTTKDARMYAVRWNDSWYVFDKNYEFPNYPKPHKVYLYLTNGKGEAIDAVVGNSRQRLMPGDTTTFIKRVTLKGISGLISEGVDVKGLARVITKAEYETWHVFVKA